MQLSHNASVDLYCEKIVAEARLVVVYLLGGKSCWPYGVEQIVETCAGTERASMSISRRRGPDVPRDPRHRSEHPDQRARLLRIAGVVEDAPVGGLGVARPVRMWSSRILSLRRAPCREHRPAKIDGLGYQEKLCDVVLHCTVDTLL